MSDVRKQTSHLMELMDQGLLDPRAIADAALLWLEEWDVVDMSHHNELPMHPSLCDGEELEEEEAE